MKISKSIFGFFLALLLVHIVVNAGDILLPDLVIDSITFQEYLNSTNMTFVNVTTVVKNIGNVTAGNSTTRLQGLVQFNKFTPSLAPGANNSLEVSYACTTPHDFIATADVFNAVNETNEENNAKFVFINCIV